ncbi:MAG: 2-succinyl-5-enolpyruvyl-6-hydroxy-3-cyclohexene-1-carboxylic-acid synthase, partial [Ruminiclostridium sp.]|nr:2-succinyl-5-enolpyruvyl-6-hydroxy-3-cyclohexene-1-carboxylic-acid synthase [Ruminiclostridium sp.]
IADSLGLRKIYILSDPNYSGVKKAAEVFADLDRFIIINEISPMNFLYAYKNATYVITDSFHGTCFSYIFHKNFNVFYNSLRGSDRFESLMKILRLENRRIYTDEHIQPDLSSVNFSEADKNISETRKKSLDWLKTVLQTPKAKLPSIWLANPNIEMLHKNPDFIKIRILATLLRDYGIKHIVLSPGGRDVPLVRMFEYNEDQFILHRVTDERSAAYFGLGIAAQLRQPVVCVCTSGTAASNYLPAVTEAYYTGIPLIVVTADRQQIYLNHGEDQTIPQQHIYDGVVKKSVTIPEGAGYKAEYQTRRDISDCILESTHNGFGPVHINIAIDNISIGANVERRFWKLLPFIYPHILRVSLNDGESEMMKWVNALKKSTSILVVYGQNPPPTKEQLKNIEAFASKFNCVIVTDYLANLDCAYSLKPHNMLNAISGEEFNRQLSPDILITVGGKRLMNDPLTFKIRGGRGNVRHWSVTPDGKVKDFYFRLSSVIEMSQDSFFEWFANHAGDIRNNGVYYGIWKKLSDKYFTPIVDAFNASYINSLFIPSIPENSVLHLGVGMSFFDCRRYPMHKNVEVFCNMGTNGIDGCTSTFMGQCSVVKDKLCFLLVGDLSFFYDMNGIWNKQLNKNIRILMVNNNGTGLLRGHNLKAISSVHNTSAKGWVESVGFKYISANTKEEYEKQLNYFISNESEQAIFFEVFCN